MLMRQTKRHVVWVTALAVVCVWRIPSSSAEEPRSDLTEAARDAGVVCGEPVANPGAASAPGDEQSSLRTIRVGVLSPVSGASRSIGSAHEESIELAHRLQGRKVRVGETLVEVELVKRDYQSQSDCAAKLARDLVDKDQVVALLGPVNSQAVERVITELKKDKVSVPVLSALATAPSLTSEPGGNFFRLVFDDDSRMRQYATFIEKQGITGRILVLYDESSTYGLELYESFRKYFQSEKVDYIAWGELSGEQHLVDATGKPGAQRDYEKWIERVRNAKNPQLANAKAAILLGSSAGALPLADLLVEGEGSPQIFLVGSSRHLFGTAPEGAYTIGDPKIDPFRAETPEQGARFTRVLQIFERQHFQSRDDFIPTAYDAYVTVHEALSLAFGSDQAAGLPGQPRTSRGAVDVLRGALGLELARADDARVDVLDPERLREALLRVLRNGRFNSISSWRKISFDSRGNLEDDPVAPVYRIRRDAARAEEEDAHDWVDVTVDPNQRLYWGPVSVTLSPHGLLNGVSSDLYLLREDASGRKAVVEQRLVTFGGGPSVEDFYFLRPGRYFVQLKNDYSPVNAGFVVGWTEDYFVAFVVAILAGSLVAQRDGLRGRRFKARVFSGGAAAIALVAITVFMNRWIQIPFLTGSPALTSLFIGLVSGSAGPTMVAGLLDRLASRVTGTSDRGEASMAPGFVSGLPLNYPKGGRSAEQESRPV